MISVRQATEFHGHLGPYLILGLLAGELALAKLNCKKYFGLKVKVYGALVKPKSCLIDGLQLSTGATYGKGNIQKYAGENIRIVFIGTKPNKTVKITLKKPLIIKLTHLETHAESEKFARKLINTNYRDLFNLK